MSTRRLGSAGSSPLAGRDAGLFDSKLPRLWVVMGVSGCGKSTVAAALAEYYSACFRDGDDDHPPTNIAKMSRGEALTDEDRWPWLRQFAEGISAESGLVVAACSALRRRYRDFILAEAGEPVLFIHLEGSRELIGQRLAARSGHFMPASLLDSQFLILERPAADEQAIVVDIQGSIADIVQRVRGLVECS